MVFSISNDHTNFHLFFNQIFGLIKVAHKLFPLHFLKYMYFVLVNDISSFEVSFFVLKFSLLVSQFLSQKSLFVIQIQEHGQVFIQFLFLFSLNYLFDLPSLHNFISGFFLLTKTIFLGNL